MKMKNDLTPAQTSDTGCCLPVFLVLIVSLVLCIRCAHSTQLFVFHLFVHTFFAPLNSVAWQKLRCVFDWLSLTMPWLSVDNFHSRNVLQLQFRIGEHHFAMILLNRKTFSVQVSAGRDAYVYFVMI